MDEEDVLTERFEGHRPRLRAVAYQALGSASEADDAVQETWLRLSRADPAAIENLGGWLTTVVARVCLNMLAARRDEPGNSPARVSRHRHGQRRPRSRGAAGRLHRPRAPDHPAHAGARRTDLLRLARHLRRAVR
jgi:DNA-directed RNA polymerase specialized sigma24 family protein